MIDHTVKKDPNINNVEILFRSTFHKPIPLSTRSKRNELFQKKEKNYKEKTFLQLTSKVRYEIKAKNSLYSITSKRFYYSVYISYNYMINIYLIII